ncbi:MAG: BON domain-containing protein [Acidimicrobiia bacterium]|nr:BON domain-containing protein [Acidimicrobiia bacterium]
MDELRDRLRTARPSNWAHWPTVRELWPWFAALGLVALIAIPWGIRAEERSLEASSRDALSEAGIAYEDISFTGRQATIAADLTTDEQIKAVSVLADMGGVSSITWEETSGTFAAGTPTTSAAPTTTVPIEPGADLTASVSNGEITLRGTVPNAQTIKDVSDAAKDIWGNRVVNQMFVDGSTLPHTWLGRVDESIGMLSTLIDPQLSLDFAGATLTGAAISQDVLDSAVERLTAALGDVPIDNKVRVTSLELPTVQIIAPGDGTIDLTGTVANAAIRRNIALAVQLLDAEAEVATTMQVSETTADVYLTHRLPEMISVLGTADQWTLQFDGESLGGGAVGGKAFNGNRVKPTAQLEELMELFASFLQADPHLTLAIEIHATPREGVDAVALAQERADKMVEQMVRLGIDPARLAAQPGPGDGELLRFMLVPAEK